MAGDPTEGALLTTAAKAGLDQATVRDWFPRVAALPFDSDRGYMATLHSGPDGTAVGFVKGAVERILAMASTQLGPNGSQIPLDDDSIHAHTDRLASAALRVLTLARVQLPATTTTLTEEMLAGHLSVIGLQAMYDPPRQAAIDAVATCVRAGIEVKMITGDRATTALAIATQFGLGGLGDGKSPALMTGRELAVCPRDELSDAVERTTAVALGVVLAVEPKEPGIMRRAPLPPSRSILGGDMAVMMTIATAIMLAGAFALFHWELSMGASIDEARTVAVNVFIFIEIAYLLNCRSLTRSFIQVGPFTNPWAGVGIGTMVRLQLLYTSTPWMQNLFHTAPVDGLAWLRVIDVAIAAFALVELEKTLRRRHTAREESTMPRGVGT